MAEGLARRTRVEGRADKLLPILVKYYKRMRRGRTYPVHISWKRAQRGVAAKAVTIRLEVAGSIVVPREQTMRPADPEDHVTFFVTPLSSGKLRHHVVELHYDQVKIYEMPLKARVGTQCFTWFLLAVTFLVPWLLTSYCKEPYEREGQKPKESMTALIQENLPDLSEMTKALGEWFKINAWLKTASEHIGTGYARLCEWCQTYEIATYAGLSLFGLTLISAWWHRAKRKRRMSNPIPLPE